MSVHTRKHPTKSKKNPPPVELRFIGPSEHRDYVTSIAESHGFVDVSGTLSFEEAFPDFHPGDAIKGLRYVAELTQVQLAEMTGIPRRHLSEMENGKRPVGKKNAQLLAKALKTNYRVFL